jgi:hypothetical protein
MHKRCLDAINRVVVATSESDQDVLCGLYYVASVLVVAYQDVTRLCQLAYETATMVDYEDPELVVLWALVMDNAVRRFPKSEFLQPHVYPSTVLTEATCEHMQRLQTIGTRHFTATTTRKEEGCKKKSIYEVLETDCDVLAAVWTFCNLSPYVVGMAFLKKHGARKLTTFLYSHLYCCFAGFTELPTYMLDNSCTQDQLSRAVRGIDDLQVQRKLNNNAR